MKILTERLESKNLGRMCLPYLNLSLTLLPLKKESLLV